MPFSFPQLLCILSLFALTARGAKRKGWTTMPLRRPQQRDGVGARKMPGDSQRQSQQGVELDSQPAVETPIHRHAWHVLAPRSSCGRPRDNHPYSLWFRLRAQPEAGLCASVVKKDPRLRQSALLTDNNWRIFPDNHAAALLSCSVVAFCVRSMVAMILAPLGGRRYLRVLGSRRMILCSRRRRSR